MIPMIRMISNPWLLGLVLIYQMQCVNARAVAIASHPVASHPISHPVETSSHPESMSHSSSSSSSSYHQSTSVHTYTIIHTQRDPGLGIVPTILILYAGMRLIDNANNENYNSMAVTRAPTPIRQIGSDECVKKCTLDGAKDLQCNVVCVCPKCLSKFLCSGLINSVETMNQSMYKLNHSAKGIDLDELELLEQSFNESLKEKESLVQLSKDFRKLLGAKLLKELPTNLTHPNQSMVHDKVSKLSDSMNFELIEYISDLTEWVNDICSIHALKVDADTHTNVTLSNCGSYQAEECEDICQECETEYICNQTISAIYPLIEIFANTSTIHAAALEMINLCQQIDGYVFQYSYTFSSASKTYDVVLAESYILVCIFTFVSMFT